MAERKCRNESCGRVFDGRATQVFCSKSCCTVQVQRECRKRRALACLDCGRPTNAKGVRCRPCMASYRAFLSHDMTLAEHYETVQYIRKNPAQKNGTIRLLAKYHNRDLVGRPCQQCGYDKHTQLAHIKAISSFPLTARISEVNAKTNLAVLCPNCHWELDHGHITTKDLVGLVPKVANPTHVKEGE